MNNEVCPKCDTVMVYSEHEKPHWDCPVCGLYMTDYMLKFPETQKTVPLHTYEYIEHAVKAAREVC
jgi:Zn ribbon nucleic-acid-binding protein